MYIISNHIYKMHNSIDLNYINSVGFSLVVLDDYMSWCYSDVIHSRTRGTQNELTVTNDTKEHISRLQEIEFVCYRLMTHRYENLIVRWPVQNEKVSVSPSFLFSLFLFVPKIAKMIAYNTLLTNHQVLSAVYNHFAKQHEHPILYYIRQQEVRSVMTCFFEDHYQRKSFLTETCIFCPLTIAQTRCIQALLRRWDFALQNSKSPRVYDVTANLLFELLRVYTHPILAGCSEPVLQETFQSDWIATFRKSSSKVMVCDYLMKAYQSVCI